MHQIKLGETITLCIVPQFGVAFNTHKIEAVACMAKGKGLKSFQIYDLKALNIHSNSTLVNFSPLKKYFAKNYEVSAFPMSVEECKKRFRFITEAYRWKYEFAENREGI